MVGVPLLVALSILVHPGFWGLALLGFGLYCATPYRRLRAAWRRPLAGGRRLTWPQRLYTLALVPLIRVTGDVAEMLGYPA